MNRHRTRGSALVLAMVVVLILSAIAVAVIRLGSNEVAAAIPESQRKALQQCAGAAVKLLSSKFHALGIEPNQITALNVPLDGIGGSTLAVGGHIDTMGVTLGQVTYLPSGAFGPPKTPEITNRIVGADTLGGRPMKVVVHCQDHGDGTPTSGRQLEVELGVRFGL